MEKKIKASFEFTKEDLYAVMFLFDEDNKIDRDATWKKIEEKGEFVLNFAIFGKQAKSAKIGIAAHILGSDDVLVEKEG